MNSAKHVDFVKSGPVVRLTINRPDTRNAISLQTALELRDAVVRAERDPRVRVIVLTGSGDRAFASGADLDEISSAMDTPRKAARYDAQIERLYGAFLGSRLPIIARIQAPAIGGGCLLALACDIRVASASATLGVPVARIGLMLSACEHQMLLENLTPSQAKTLLFSGRRLSAREAADWDLVDLVVPAESLDKCVDELAHQIAAGAPRAVSAAKRLVRAVTRNVKVAQVSKTCYRDVYTSKDLREGLAALRERRTPVFHGR